MALHMLAQMYLEYAVMFAPKTGDTSVSSTILKSIVVLLLGVTSIYTYVKYNKRIKKNQAINYPDIRLNINGDYLYY